MTFHNQFGQANPAFYDSISNSSQAQQPSGAVTRRVSELHLQLNLIETRLSELEKAATPALRGQPPAQANTNNPIAAPETPLCVTLSLMQERAIAITNRIADITSRLEL